MKRRQRCSHSRNKKGRSKRNNKKKLWQDEPFHAEDDRQEQRHKNQDGKKGKHSEARSQAKALGSTIARTLCMSATFSIILSIVT